MTQPIFVVGSGRCGTESIAKLFQSYPGSQIEAHHEYMIHRTQPLGFKKETGLLTRKQIIEELKQIYEPALYYSKSAFWLDSSNKDSWLITELNEIFPNAKFVWIVRDGRRVVSSMQRKLADECYNKWAVNIMRDWVSNAVTLGLPEPPHEKVYWWPLPTMELIEGNMSQFELICSHWDWVNKEIQRQLKNVSLDKQFFVKLEDLTDKWRGRDYQMDLFDFLGIEYAGFVEDFLSVPRNVHRPISYPLTQVEEAVFWSYCKDMMEELEYTGDDYAVRYT